MFHPNGPTFWELAEQALSSTDRGYDLLAPKFDYTPFRTPDSLLEIAARRTKETGPIRRALDVCCGTGAAMRAFRPLCEEAIVGLDRSAGMLAEAARRLQDAPGTAPFSLVRGDALAMPFGREFDLATCFGAFGHILEEDEPRFVDAIARVLVPGGRFVFVTSELPPITSPELWMARAFNAAMRIRNAILKPEFVMYYLTFLLPKCQRLLEARGFEVKVEAGLFDKPFARLRLVTATLRS
ncbi:MAG TPA: class I SAM-dependent methyltransferase [Sandaracinaceae bacterium]